MEFSNSNSNSLEEASLLIPEITNNPLEPSQNYAQQLNSFENEQVEEIAEMLVNSAREMTITVVEEITVMGDITGDGGVDFDDARELLRSYRPGVAEPDDPRDINGDGQLSLLDVRELGIIVRDNDDLTAPNLLANLVNDTGSSKNDQFTSDPRISGTLTDDNIITRFSAGFDNTSVDNYVNILGILNEDGIFSLDEIQLQEINNNNPLTDGEHTLHLFTKDQWNNITTFELDFILDSNAPNISLSLLNDTGSSDNDFITNNPVISGTVNDESIITELKAGFDDAIEADLRDVLEQLQPDGSFNFDTAKLQEINNNTELSQGEHTLKIIAIDEFGNTTNLDLSFTLDTSAPTLELLTPLVNGQHSSTARLIGTVIDTLAETTQASFILDGSSPITLNLDETGDFDQVLSLSSLTVGTHQVTLFLTDRAGNQTQQTIDFEVGNEFIVGETGTSGWGASDQNVILLGERDSFLVQTELLVDLALTEGSRTISFDLEPFFDTSANQNLSEDRLAVYLLAPDNPSQILLDNGIAGTPFFSLAGEEAEFTPGLVHYDGTTVEVDLSSLGDLDQGLLRFQWLNSDEDTGSFVKISHLTNEVDTTGNINPVFLSQNSVASVGEALDLSLLSASNDLEVLLSHVSYDSQTGEYKANLQVRNTGEGIDRNVAVVFPNLPDGVTLKNPSGVDENGFSYLNLRTAIAPGGLEKGAFSTPVPVIFENPHQLRFSLTPVVYGGGANMAPIFPEISPLTISPGERLEMPLTATDANGDNVTFRLSADGALPTGRLEGNGTLIFNPSPDEIGSYEFTLIASDGLNETRQTVTLNVVEDPITTTRISGVIENIDREPLAGVVIELGNLQTITAPDGSFTLETADPLTADTLLVRGELLSGDEVYPFIAEKLPLVLGQQVYEGYHNIINRPIYLPPIDVANGEIIDPTVDVTVTTEAIPSASVFVEAGSLLDQQGNPFTGTLSITEVPNELTPAALPTNLAPDLVVTIQPGEMVFTTPAPLSLPNGAGYEPGTEMDLWSINPNTGDFDNVGTGRVTEDGTTIETVEGGINNSSWHFFAPRPTKPEPPEENDRNKEDGCKSCEITGSFNSEVEFHSGAVVETHDLVTYQSNGVNRGLQLTYDSLRADPRPIVHFDYDNVTGGDDRRLLAELTFKRAGLEYQVPGFAGGKYGLNGGEHFWSLPEGESNVDVALQGDLSHLPSGQYQYELTTGIYRFSRPSWLNAPRFFGSSSTSTGTILHVNSLGSPFGNGWGLSGWQELVENDDGSVLLIDGNGGEFLFELSIEDADGSYVSPPGDFSTLERLEDGTFRRTSKDQTIITFNVQNKLESLVDRNGNETRYVYNDNQQLTRIIDPVGLETTFTYTDSLVTAITDPNGRQTQLEYDITGNLIRIVDPDGTNRTWEYDTKHHMVSEIDQRGNIEQAVYDEFGRAKTAVRQDGSTVQVAPVQVEGLYPSHQTIDPLNAPIARSTTEETTSSYADSNGNVTSTQLDQAGQAVSSRDGEGILPSVTRNSLNLITSQTSGRGHRTDYEYDEKGNVIRFADSLSGERELNTRDSLFPRRVNLTGAAPVAMVTGDINRDGYEDIITANYWDDSLSILFGTRGGSLAPKIDYAIGSKPTAVAIGDLNNDGLLDLIAANGGDNNVSVLWGDENGSFEVGQLLAVGANPSAIAVEDFNQDGSLDLAVTNELDNNVSVLWGDGNGSFEVGQLLTVGANPNAIATGDFNNDGSLDLAVTNELDNNVSVLWGDGNGSFEVGQLLTVGANPNAIATGDFNNDGSLDLAVTNEGDNNVSVLWGDGNSSFEVGQSLAVRYDPSAIVTADFNNDGSLDLAVINESRNNVSVFLGNTDASFDSAINYELKFYGVPVAVAVTDLNRDGTLDLLTANSNSDSVSIFLGNGDGSFINPLETNNYDYSVTGNAESVFGGDLDGNGFLDLAVASNSGVSILLGNGDGSFGFHGDYPVVGATFVALEDLNGDNHLDLVTANRGDFFQSGQSISVWLGNGDGTFSSRTDYTVGRQPTALSFGDLNNDSHLDLIVANFRGQTISLLLGNGDGTFAPPTDYATNLNPANVAVGDVNRDGELDVITANSFSNSVSLFLGNGDGTLANRIDYSAGSSPTELILEDINGDGHLDLVTNSSIEFLGQSLLVWLGNGDGTFAASTEMSIPAFSLDISFDELNNDNRLDLIVVDSSFNRVLVYLGLDDGLFEEPLSFAVGDSPYSVFVGDLDNDGDSDIVTANRGDRSVSVALNQTQGIGVSLGLGERRYTYDPVFNQLTSFTDELGRQTFYEIDPNTGNTLSMTQVIGQLDTQSDETDDIITHYTYTSRGLIDTVTDPLGRITDYDYDGLGRQIKVTYALGTVDEAFVQYEYDLAGNVTAMIDEKGHRTEYSYDLLNRLTQIIEPDPDENGSLTSPITTFTYDEVGNLLTVSDARNSLTQYEYDELNRLITTTDANNEQTYYGYDEVGNLVSSLDELNRETRYVYDSRNRLIETIDPLGNATNYGYDFDNNLTTITDPLGNQTTFVYDARDRLIREFDALGNDIFYQYDAVNNLIATEDKLGRRTTFNYDQLNRLTTETDPLNGLMSYDYDAASNLTSLTDELNRTTNYTYDARNRLITEIDPLNGVMSYDYDAASNLTSLTDELNRTTNFTYDALNRQTAIIDPLNHTTTYSYDGVDNLTSITDALGRITQFDYDALNRLTVLTNAKGDTIANSYDAVDNLTAVTDELGRTTNFTYDQRNLQTAIIDPLGHSTTYNYDAVGNLIAVTDGVGNTTTYNYDELYRQTAIIDAENQTTSFTYDAEDNLLTITDPENNTTTYTYDELDRLITDTNQLGDSRFYTYDAVSNLIGLTDRNNRTTTYTYDPLNRQTAEVWLDETNNPINQINYSYDAASQLTEVNDNYSNYTYVYDQAGRLIEVDNQGTPGVNHVVLNYTYDAVNNLLSVTDTIDGEQKGIESFIYDQLNRLITLTQTGNGVTDKRIDYSYDAASQRTNLKRYGDLSGTNLIAETVYNYDEAGRLTQLIHQQDSEIIAQYEWVYDAANRILKVTSPDGVTDYSYDEIDQLIDVNSDYQDNESYSYDDNGNRINEGYVTGENNRLLSDGIYNYEYDAEGNLIKKITIETGEIIEYEWDHRNRLVKVIEQDSEGTITQEVEFTYDAFNRRIAKLVDSNPLDNNEGIVTHFVYNGEDINLEFVDSDGMGIGNEPILSQRYLHGTGIDEILAQEEENGDIIWMLTDHLGTVRDLINSNGDVVNHLVYDSFGNVISESNSSVDTRYLFTGREFDEEIGLYYYRARYYDAQTGRFVSEDTIGFAGGDENLYRYVGNSPTNYIDPDGNIAISLAVGVGLGLTALGLGAVAIQNITQDIDSQPPELFDPNNLNRPVNNLKESLKDTVEQLIPPNVDTGTKPFPGNVDNNRPQVEKFPGNSCPADLAPPFFDARVDTRINIANTGTRFTPLRGSGHPVSSGFDHVLDQHFNREPANSRSIFTVTPQELKTILQSKPVVNSPVIAETGGQFVRVADTGQTVGITALKDGGNPTSKIKVFTDSAGNLITTYPVP